MIENKNIDLLILEQIFCWQYVDSTDQNYVPFWLE